MKLERCSYRLQRKCTGNGIVESAAALVIIAMTMVIGVVLLCDFGTVVCYKIKLNAIADAASRYAADQTYSLGARRPASYFSAAQIQTLTDTVVEDLLKDEGLYYGPANAPITSDPTGAVCVVTLTAANLPMPFSIGPLPQTISDTEIAAVPYPNDQPIAVLNLNWTSGTNAAIILPCYGMFAGNVGGYTDMNSSFGGTPPTSGVHNPYPGAAFPYWVTGIYQTGPNGP